MVVTIPFALLAAVDLRCGPQVQTINIMTLSGLAAVNEVGRCVCDQDAHDSGVATYRSA